MSEKDNLYEDSHQAVGDFVFDERVVRVFPDMINRSVPGYSLVLQMIGILAQRYVQQDSHVYDLGCSLGAATLVMRQTIEAPGVRFIAVDSSAAMIRQCRQNLGVENCLNQVDLKHGDVCQTKIDNASMTVLNFTLQFIQPERRLPLLEQIAAGTRPGGILVLSEKIRFTNPEHQEVHSNVHHDFKRAQGYSDLEIARKRDAVERVLQPDTEHEHLERLKAAGWRQSMRFFQALNFVSYLAFR